MPFKGHRFGRIAGFPHFYSLKAWSIVITFQRVSARPWWGGDTRPVSMQAAWLVETEFLPETALQVCMLYVSRAPSKREFALILL